MVGWGEVTGKGLVATGTYMICLRWWQPNDENQRTHGPQLHLILAFVTSLAGMATPLSGWWRHFRTSRLCCKICLQQSSKGRRYDKAASWLKPSWLLDSFGKKNTLRHWRKIVSNSFRLTFLRIRQWKIAIFTMWVFLSFCDSLEVDDVWQIRSILRVCFSSILAIKLNVF